MYRSVQGNEPELIEDLTRRELDVLELLVEKRSNREIADQLVLSINTVKWYARQIYDKLDVSNRRQAARKARRLNLLNPTGREPSLPAPITPLVGREEEVDEISRLLTDSEVRLLTITGLGGIGKSRLAIEVASRISRAGMEAFQDGVTFVPLAPLSGPDAIPSTVAAAIGLRFESKTHDAMQVLLNHLRTKTLLLVLDNFDHLLAGVSLVRDILASASNVRALVTSREPLGLKSEWVFEIQGLDFPLIDLPARIDAYPSMSFFQSCARRQDRRVSFSPDEVRSIGRICQLVEGMPLAIELAAAWIPTLNCKQIASEIESNLDILAAEWRDLPPRQRSIRAVLEPSWLQLQEGEREILAGLSVFVGGFTREAAEGVAEADLTALASLGRKSFLRRVESDRYDMHELVKQFSREKLHELGVEDQARRAHAFYFGSSLAALHADLKGQAQLYGLDQITRDWDNIRTAWDWAIGARDFEILQQLLDSLYLYSVFRRGGMDVDRLSEDAREKLRGISDEVGQWFLSRLVARHESLNIDIARSTGLEELKRVKGAITECLAYAQKIGDQEEVLFCLHALGRAEVWLGHTVQALELFEQALEIARGTDDAFYECYLLYRIGLCWSLQGDKTTSIKYVRQSLAVARQTDNRYVAAWALGTLASDTYQLGERDQAVAYRQEAIRIHEEFQDRQGAAWEKALLAFMLCLQGDIQAAETLCEEAIEDARHISQQVNSGHALAIYSWIRIASGDIEGAVEVADRARSLTENSRVGHAIAGFSLAYANCLEGNLRVGRDEILNSIRTLYKLGYLTHVLACVPVAAMIFAQMGENERAAELFGRCMTHDRRPARWLDRDPLTAQVEEFLLSEWSEPEYRIAYNRGATLDMDQLVEELDPI